MDETSSLRQRLRSTLFYLGAGLLLAESSRALLAWLESRLWSRKAGTGPVPDTGPASVAFLVDGENISSPALERLLERALDEAKKLGEVSVKRVYGSCNLFNGRWNETSLRFELEQIHLARPTANKNTADIALAVSAIELAKDAVCNRFCILTSDSDFTPLVRRLRELKCQVLGIGERKTPGTLVKACNWFVFADQLVESASSALPAHTPPAPRKQTSTRTPPSRTPASLPQEPPNGNQATPSVSPQQPASAPAAQQVEQFPSPVIAILRQAYLDAAHERPGEWVLLSRLGLSLRRLYPDFKASDYAPDLSALIRQYHNVFEFGKRANGHPQMRLKP